MIPSNMRQIGHRRFITIVYSDLSRSTELAATMEAEDFALITRRLRDVFAQSALLHGGVIVQAVGDGVVTVFGYPKPSETDLKYAVLFALDVQAKAAGISFRTRRARRSLSLHTGIHAGLSLIDDDDIARGSVDLLGNAANVAARLADAAPDGEILVSEETLGNGAFHFDVGPPRRLALQGLARPMLACPILGVANHGPPGRGRMHRSSTPFIGRGRVIAALLDRFRKTLEGTAHCVALVANAGLGKTRLAEALLANPALDACYVLRTYCDNTLRAEPLQPMLQILRTLLDVDDDPDGTERTTDVARVLEAIDPALVAERETFVRMLSLGKPTTERGAAPQKIDIDGTIRALVGLISAAAKTKPVVLFVDDFQYADDATHRAIAAIRNVVDHAVFVLLATRSFAPGEAEINDAEVFALAPLTVLESEAVVARLLPASDPFLAAEIRRHAGGSPLFIEELCHSASTFPAERRIGQDFDRVAWLHGLIDSRVAQLPVELATLIRTAAVVGNVVPAWLLQRLTGLAPDHALIRELATHDLLYPEDESHFRFKHGVVRDAIYDGVGLRRRKALHLRIASLLRKQASASPVAPSESLAYHFGAAGHWRKAASYSCQAGEKAVAASALDRAQTHYCAALDALDRVEPTPQVQGEWFAIAQRLGIACVYDPSREALEYLDRAVVLAERRGDATVEMRARYWAGNVRYAIGDSTSAIESLEDALAKARAAGRANLIVELEAILGQAHAAMSRYDDALVLLESAISAKRAHARTGAASAGLAFSLACKGAALGDRGAFAAAHACFEEARGWVSGTDHEVLGSIALWRSAVLLWEGRWTEASAAANEARAVGERVKSLYVFAMAVAHAALARWRTSDDPAALDEMSKATSWLEDRHRRLFISLNFGWLAEGFATVGNAKAARHHAAKALWRARAGDRLGLACAYRALAVLAVVRRSRSAADRYLALSLAAAAERGALHDASATQRCAEIIVCELRAATSEAIAHPADVDPDFASPTDWIPAIEQQAGSQDEAGRNGQ